MPGPLPDLESLRCFVAAAETLNFRQAARRVGLTPTALGQRIQRLEELFEVPLFYRTTRRVSLSESGLSLLPQARQALQAASDCAAAARAEEGPASLSLVIGTRHELGMSWLLPLVPELEAAFPHVTAHLQFGSGAELERGVLGQQLDCAISSLRSATPGLDYERLHEEAYGLVGAPELLAQRPVAELGDLAAHVLVDIGPALPLYSYWVAGLAERARPDFAGTRWMGTLDAIRGWVRGGHGLAVLPVYLVRDDLEAGRLVSVLPEITPQSDYFRLWFRRGDPRRRFLAELATWLRGAPLR